MPSQPLLTRRALLKLGAFGLTLPLFGILGPRARPAAANILIIGAGISGLAAARRLIDEYGLASSQITILEARNRIGGRIATDHSLGYPIDMGAMWIHGVTGNPITALATQYNAQLFQTNFDPEPLFDIDGSRIRDADYERSYRRYRQIMKQFREYRATLAQDQSVGRSLRALGAHKNLTGPDARLMSWNYFTEIALEYSLGVQQLSSRMFDEDEIFDGPDKMFMNGYDTIVNGLANGLDIRLNQIVTSISYANGVTVNTNSGSFQADYCIVTLPLGVLQSGSVQFSPTLPLRLQDAIQRLGFGRVYKHALIFDHVFWNDAHTFGKIGSPSRKFGNGAHLEFVNYAPVSGHPVLIAFAGGAFAYDLETMSAADATARLMQEVRAMFGINAPDPLANLRSEFINSPFTRGAYTYWASNSTAAHMDAFTNDLNGQLFFAGEHTNSTYPQTVHGAYLSGRAAARRLANVI